MNKLIKVTMILFVISIVFTGCGNKSSTNSSSPSSNAISSTQGVKIPFNLVKNGNFKGNKDAKVTIVEFSDFQCPACGQMSGVIDQVVNTYPNDVVLVYRNFPLSMHPYAQGAALAAEAAGLQGKYWEMHDLLFANQTKLTDSDLVKYAQQLGLNINQFNTDRASQDLNNKIKDDLADGTATNLQGTPTFYINNIEYTGAYTLDGFKQAINRLITK